MKNLKEMTICDMEKLVENNLIKYETALSNKKFKNIKKCYDTAMGDLSRRKPVVKTEVVITIPNQYIKSIDNKNEDKISIELELLFDYIMNIAEEYNLFNVSIHSKDGFDGIKYIDVVLWEDYGIRFSCDFNGENTCIQPLGHNKAEDTFIRIVEDI